MPTKSRLSTRAYLAIALTGVAAVLATAAIFVLGVGRDTTTGTSSGDTPAAPPPSGSTAAGPPTATASPSDAWPNSANTGWKHTGVTLAPYTGPRTITEKDTVIDGKAIDVCLNIQATGVKISRSRVRCGSWYPVEVADKANLTITDTEVDGLGFSGGICIGFSNYTALRIDCHGMGDGLRFGENVAVTDSYVHGLVNCGDCHTDAAQATGGTNVVLRHNSLENPYGETSCILLGNEFGPLRNVLIENNLINGGGWAVYGGGEDSNVDHIRFIGNHFVRAPQGFWPEGGYWGPVSAFGRSRPGNVWSGNVWHDNGQTINF